MQERTIKFRVQGEPVPMPRPRTVTKGGKTWTYSGNKAVRAYMKAIKAACMDSPHHFDEAMLVALLATEKSVDVDNVGKSIMDALTGVLWDNDNVVWNLHVTRLDNFNKDAMPFTDIQVIGREPDSIQTKLGMNDREAAQFMELVEAH